MAGRALRGAKKALLYPLAALAFISSASSAKPLDYTVGVAGQKISVDGKADEACWENASWITLDKVLNSATSMVYESKAKIVSSSKGLGLFAIIKEPGALSTRNISRGNVSSDDYIMLVVDPTNQGNAGRYFKVNIIGTMEEGTIENCSDKKTTDYRWTAKALKNSSGYQVEMWLTPEAVGGAGNSWLFNVVQNRMAVGQTVGAFGSPGIFCTEGCGTLDFIESPVVATKTMELIPTLTARSKPGESTLGSDYLDGGVDLAGKLDSEAYFLTWNTQGQNFDVIPTGINLSGDPRFSPENRKIFTGMSFSNIFFSRKVGAIDWGVKSEYDKNGTKITFLGLGADGHYAYGAASHTFDFWSHPFYMRFSFAGKDNEAISTASSIEGTYNFGTSNTNKFTFWAAQSFANQGNSGYKFLGLASLELTDNKEYYLYVDCHDYGPGFEQDTAHFTQLGIRGADLQAYRYFAMPLGFIDKIRIYLHIARDNFTYGKMIGDLYQTYNHLEFNSYAKDNKYSLDLLYLFGYHVKEDEAAETGYSGFHSHKTGARFRANVGKIVASAAAYYGAEYGHKVLDTTANAQANLFPGFNLVLALNTNNAHNDEESLRDVGGSVAVNYKISPALSASCQGYVSTYSDYYRFNGGLNYAPGTVAVFLGFDEQRGATDSDNVMLQVSMPLTLFKLE